MGDGNLRVRSRNASGSYNRLLVLQHIRRFPGISRAALARKVGITAPAVTPIVSFLLEEGYVRENGNRQGKFGRPSIGLELVENRAYTVGLHFDHQRFQAALVNLGGNLEESRSIFVKDITHPKDLVETLTGLYRDVSSTLPADADVLGVGLAAMGPIDVPRGRVCGYSPDMEWREYPLVQKLEHRIGHDIFLENNFSAMATNSVWAGDKGFQNNALYIYIGYGVGGALIVDGRIHRGSSRNAGEIGHINIERNGRPCVCGARGCMENYVSFRALVNDLGLEFSDLDVLLERFRQKNAPLLEWLDRAADALAVSLGGAINLLDVDTVLYSGLYPGEILDDLMKRARKKLPEFTMKARPTMPRIVKAIDRMPALCAATLNIYETLSPGKESKIM